LTGWDTFVESKNGGPVDREFLSVEITDERDSLCGVLGTKEDCVFGVFVVWASVGALLRHFVVKLGNRVV